MAIPLRHLSPRFIRAMRSATVTSLSCGNILIRPQRGIVCDARSLSECGGSSPQFFCSHRCTVVTASPDPQKYTAKWRYWVWLVLAVRLLVPFSPSLPRTPIEITPPSQNIVLSVPMQNAIALPLTDHTAVAQAAVRTMTLNEILSIVWVLGIAVFLLYHLAGYFYSKDPSCVFQRL